MNAFSGDSTEYIYISQHFLCISRMPEVKFWFDIHVRTHFFSICHGKERIKIDWATISRREIRSHDPEKELLMLLLLLTQLQYDWAFGWFASLNKCVYNVILLIVSLTYYVRLVRRSLWYRLICFDIIYFSAYWSGDLGFYSFVNFFFDDLLGVCQFYEDMFFPPIH